RYVFFFSSRRRHTRSKRDWSSDVCSSDLKKGLKDEKIDVLIVVGMFLTGFDSKKLNTLYVDKNLRHHDLIQAYSRTNRVEKKTRSEERRVGKECRYQK